MQTHITMHGPFRSTRESESAYPHVPYYCDMTVVKSPGVYLQVVRLNDVYRVAYVGQTGVSFEARLGSENRAWRCGTDQRAGEKNELHPQSFRAGVRAYLQPAKDKAEQTRWRTEILDHTLLFLAPLSR